MVATVNDANHQGTASGTLSIAKAAQAIAFNPPATRTFGDPAFDLAPLATGGGSGNAVSFAVTSGPGSLAGSILSLTGAGTVVVTASQAGGANHLAAPDVAKSIVVGKAAAAVTLVASSLSATYDGNPKAAVATTTPAGLAVNLTYAGSATIPTGAGGYAVVATVNDANHQGTASGTLTIAKAAQSVTFAPPPTMGFGGAPVDLAAFAIGGASGNPVTFVVTSGPGSLAGSVLTITGAGSVVLTASQAGDANHAEAAPVQATILVDQAAQSIAFTPPATATFGDAALDLAPFATGGASGNPVTFAVTSGPGSVSGSLLTFTGAGTVVVTAHQAGDANYADAVAPASITVAKAAQSIAFNPPATRTFGDVPIDLATFATGTASGNPVTFAVTSGPGSLAGTTLTITGAGTVVVTASQAASADYTAAADVPRSITVGKATATVTLVAASLSATYDGTPKAAAVTTAPAGLTVNVTYAGSATAPTSAGTYAVVATVSDANHQGSASGSLSIARATQSVAFNPPATKTYGDAAFDLAPFATGGASGTAVTFAVVSGPASLAGSTLSLTGAGAVVLSASQAGTANYDAASSQATITVSRATTLATVIPSVASPVSGQPLAFVVQVTAPGAVPTGSVSLLDGPAVLGTGTLAGGTATISLPGGLLVGSHALSATYAGDANVLAAAPATLTYVVGKSTTAVALSSSRPGATSNQPVTFTATVAATVGAGAPTGTVTFVDGATAIGTGTLSGGVASVTVRSLTRGTHPITADYSGDAQFLASSGTLTGGQVVPDSPPVAGSGHAVTFDGETQDARIQDAGGALDGARTVELWFKAQPGTGTACLVQQGEGAGLRFGLCLSADRGSLIVRRGAEAVHFSATIGTSWHHLALVAADGGTVLFLDGVEAAALSGGFGSGTQQPVVVGAAPSAGAATDRFAGTVDELRLWSSARTASELAASARQPVPGDASGLLGLWRFDEGSGAALFDAAPSHLEATLTAPSGATWILSDAWKRRATKQERLLAPFVAGYDPDGDPITVTLASPAQSGQASVAGDSVSYMPQSRFVGLDTFACEVASGGLTSRFTTEVDVSRIEVCQVPADCAAGDTCADGLCVPPAAPKADSGGCGCTSSGQGAPVGLLALVLLALMGRRRSPQGMTARRP